MSDLYVEKVRDTERRRTPVFDELERVWNDTRQRVYQLFQQGGGAAGFEVDDWLPAERDLLWLPQAELIEDESQVRLQMAVPGIQSGNLRVTALPQSIIVRAEIAHQHDKKEGKVHFCEFSERRLLRKFDFNVPIDLERVTANLNKGVLEVQAAKAATQEQGRTMKVNAAA